MKKILLASFLLLFPISAFCQTVFPYSKILRMTTEELVTAKFKYDSNKNQYVLNKGNGLQGTMNVLSALNGTTADIRPHVDDYRVIVQYGDEGVACLTVTFYNDDIYHDIMTFANDSGENLLETNSGAKRKVQFNYDGLAFELETETKGITATTGRTNSAIAKTIDNSYNIHTYSIITGIEANSPWHQKEFKKQQKRDDKGKKKRSASELM